MPPKERKCRVGVTYKCGKGCRKIGKVCKMNLKNKGGGGKGKRKTPTCTGGVTYKCGKVCRSIYKQCKVPGFERMPLATAPMLELSPQTMKRAVDARKRATRINSNPKSTSAQRTRANDVARKTFELAMEGSQWNRTKTKKQETAAKALSEEMRKDWDEFIQDNVKSPRIEGQECWVDDMDSETRGVL